MQDKQRGLTPDNCLEQLKIINKTNFTPREIDIVACLLNARGTSKIASFLDISPRTVANHIRNLMLKLGCNSREGIIDFIEKTNKQSLLRMHYSNLVLDAAFKGSLKVISKLTHKLPTYSLVFWKELDDRYEVIEKLKEHLELAGVKTHLEMRDMQPSIDVHLIDETKDGHYRIYLLPEELRGLTTSFSKDLFTVTNQVPLNSLFLYIGKGEQEDVSNKLTCIDCINSTEHKSYYIVFFEILKKLLPHSNVESIVEEFKQQYELMNESSETKNHQEGLISQKELPCSPIKKNFVRERKWSLLVGLIIAISILSFGFFIVGEETEKESRATDPVANQSSSPIHSNLIVQNKTTLLNRPELMDQIDSKFKRQGGIQSVALIGIGGAGKTTLARRYAHQQQAGIIWEINAETHVSLTESFERLSQSLSKTEKDQKILTELQEIKNSVEREEKIILFVKERLKFHQPWFLIYDNVENFTNIQKYFPHDSNAWGEGKIILATRNTNIQNNSQIDGIIPIGELTPNQKFSLFMQIMNHGERRELTAIQQKEVVEFLKQLPPFPLDISVAAYYLKTMNVPYGRYLEYLNHQDKNFSTIQENLLKEAGPYEKTRYNIITLSLEKLIDADKNFVDLLLFISILDSQNIPRELLDIYKGRSVVDNFIYYLKKYSLIVNSLSDSTSLLSHISVHRSTQDISFSYLANSLKLNKDSQSLKTIAYVLDDYSDHAIEQENFPKMRLMGPHLEELLTHSNLLTDFSKGLLESKLASIYYFINEDKSKQMLRENLNVLERKSSEHLSPEDKSRRARSFLHIGAIYTELRLDKEAQEILEKAINIYGGEGLKNYTELSWALSHLGNVHRRLKNYEKARDYLEESVDLHKQYGADNKRIARTLAYLGSVYRGLGFYQKAIDHLENSLELYKKNFSNDYFKIGWILTQLGNVYRELGNWEKAKGYLEEGLRIFQKHLPENDVDMGLALAYLGNYCREQGDYEKSRNYLEQSLKIYEKYYDEKHTRMGWILFHLASTYKEIGKDEASQKLFDKVLEIYTQHCDRRNIEAAHLLRDMAEICMGKNRLDDAENFIKRSLKILQDHNHAEAYKSIEILAEIYLRKFLHAKDSLESQKLKNKALDTLIQALKITEQNFSKGSLHIQRIHAKIKAIQEEK